MKMSLHAESDASLADGGLRSVSDKIVIFSMGSSLSEY